MLGEMKNKNVTYKKNKKWEMYNDVEKMCHPWDLLLQRG